MVGASFVLSRTMRCNLCHAVYLMIPQRRAPLAPEISLLVNQKRYLTRPRFPYRVLLSCSTVHPSLAKKLPAFPSNTMTSPFLKPKICARGCDSRGAGQMAFQGWRFSGAGATCSAVEEREGTREEEDMFLRWDYSRYLLISE